MGESSTHMMLVKELVRWISEHCLGGDSGGLLHDGPECTPSRKSRSIGGFTPDVLAQRPCGDGVVIGEAKTSGDIDNMHSNAQLTAYMKRCAEQGDGLLVVAVPWHQSRRMESIIRHIKRRNALDDVESVVLRKLQG